MSLKQEVGRRLSAFLKRMDDVNRSLAEQALPDSRRKKVSELSLRDKALKAGQRAVEEKVD